MSRLALENAGSTVQICTDVEMASPSRARIATQTRRANQMAAFPQSAVTVSAALAAPFLRQPFASTAAAREGGLPSCE